MQKSFILILVLAIIIGIFALSNSAQVAEATGEIGVFQVRHRQQEVVLQTEMLHETPRRSYRTP